MEVGGVGLEGAAYEGELAEYGGPVLPSAAPLDVEATNDVAIVEAGPVGTELLTEPGLGLLGATPWQRALKRAIDIFGSFVGIALLSPVFLMAALAIRLTSPGPILYRQRRVGLDGHPFTMYKFRSMQNGAHEEIGAVAHHNEASGPVFKIKDDPRRTAVGRVLRRLSIDELPQLVNVLIGQMSLVGPRPPLPEECVLYSARELSRLLVKPGITCTWQVSGRSDLDFETWVRMDLEYIRAWSLREDLKLLLLTIPAVISGKGAY